MLGFATAPLFTSIDDEDAVRSLNEKLTAAIAGLEPLQQRERRLIADLLDRGSDATESERVLEIRKGCSAALPQSWYVPEAEALRKEVKRLRAEYTVARDQAKARLEELGRQRLRPVVIELCQRLVEFQATLAELERVRMAIGEAGGRTPMCPCPTLLPGNAVEWQLELACKTLEIPRPT